ncbi:hypothetical protein [Micromonospora sp. 15K316]|uniref:hypothetical protein n=1 Tax=Micromonospora sp. 15K316 TaxID=2530376 RepID=UPI001405498B|nr:hypothetical protein [Micromonospora sp. 15K316]
MAARYPQVTCPGCNLPRKVGPSTERFMPHNDPKTGVKCANSGQPVDVYGVK